MTITPDTVARAIPAAPDGATLVLEAGVYPLLPLKYRKPNLTLILKEGAEVVGPVRTGDVDGLHFVGGLFRAGITIARGRNVSITDARFEGGEARTYNGISLQLIGGVRILRNELRDCLNGVALSQVSDFEVEGNGFERIRKDAINIFASQRGKVRKNKSRDHRPEGIGGPNPDHGDGVQLYGALGKPPTEDIDIEDNDFDVAHGQGITTTWKESKSDPRFARLAYRRNKVRAGTPYGFGMIAVDDGTLEDNVLEAQPEALWPVRFVVDPNCTDIKWIGKNLQAAFGKNPAVSWPATVAAPPPDPRIAELEAELVAMQAADAAEDAEYEARIKALSDQIAKAREALQ